MIDLRLVWAFIPLVVFTAVESWYGTRPAVVLAVLLAVGEVVYSRVREGRIRWMPAIMAGLVVVLGGLSLLSDDPVFYLWTPVIGDVAFAAMLGGSVVMGRSMLVTAMEEAEPGEPIPPVLRRFLDGATLRTALVMLAHAAVTAWATTQERAVWTLVSGPVQYVMLGAQIGGEVLWARSRVLPELDELDRRAS